MSLHERIKDSFAITKRGIVEVILAAGLLWTSLFIFELASATAYVYPNYDYGQAGWALAFFCFVAIGLIIFSVTRLIQLRILSVILIVGTFWLIVLYPPTPDRFRWKFNTYKAAYMEAINADPVAPPKFKIFDWGNRNTGLGGGAEFEAIVYDERNNIIEWRDRPDAAVAENRWITADERYPCKKSIKSLGEHFYYVSELCG
jgi:hypothetical protein